MAIPQKRQSKVSIDAIDSIDGRSPTYEADAPRAAYEGLSDLNQLLTKDSDNVESCASAPLTCAEGEEINNLNY